MTAIALTPSASAICAAHVDLDDPPYASASCVVKGQCVRVMTLKSYCFDDVVVGDQR